MKGYVKLDDVLKIIDKEFPICICKDDESVDKYCPNELMDGAWSGSINNNLKRELKQLVDKNHESDTSPAQSQKATGELGTTSVGENNNVCKCGHDLYYHGESNNIGLFCAAKKCKCNKFEPKEVKA